MKRAPVVAWGRPLERAAFSGLLLLLLWLPLPWGSHTPWAEHLLVLWAGLLLLLTCLARLSQGVQWRLPLRYGWAALLWLLWLAWIALQTWSLPATLARWSPAADAVHAAVAQPGVQMPLDTPSIMPAASLDGLLLSLGYFALYAVVAVTCRERSRRRLLIATLVLAGLAQAVYGSLMTLSGAEYGFLAKKIFYLGFATGTFVNRNHLAGYLELTSAMGLGLVLADLRSGGGNWRLRLSQWVEAAFSTKVRVRVALAMMVVALVLTRSRMGNSAFFGALTVTGLGYILLRERRLLLRAVVLFGSLLLIDTLIVSHWFGLNKVVERVEATRIEQEERPLLYRELPAAVRTYALAGAGLGSFAQAFMPYRQPELGSYYDHAHNDYLEFLIETGWPGLFLLLLLTGVHLLHALKVVWKRHDRLPQGICVGFVMASTALAVHATVEFNFQIPAIAASYICMMGLVLSCTQRSSEQHQRKAAGPATHGAADVG